MSTPAGGDPDLTGRVRLDLSGLVEGLRFAQAVTSRQISRLVRDADSRLSGFGSRISGALGSVDTGRLTAGLGRIVGMLGGLGRLAAPFAAAGLAVGGLLPLVAGLVTTLANIAPAAALGVSALAALQLLTGTFKLAMVGVGEAVKAALDPSSAEAYAEALKKLSPEARSFVEEIHKMQPALDRLRKSVQDKVFAGFDTELKNTAKAVLPTLKTALLDTAGTLNAMGKGVGAAARDLGERGILGTALKGATQGLAEFSRAPGQVVTALGEIGAAAAPSFAKLSKEGAGALDRISEKLATAFETGAMQQAIEQAIAILKQLGRIAGNIFGGIGNILKGVSVDGKGLFSTLEQITQAFQDITATKEFQSALGELSKTVGELVKAVLPLLSEAIKQLLPIIEILAPPIRELIKHLGEQLKPVIQALGPVLAAVAEAFAKLLPVLMPFVDLALRLATLILPILIPLFEFLGGVFERLAPIAEQLAKNIEAQLAPILEKLPGILEQILPKFLELADRLLPLLLDILVEIGPELGELAAALAELLVEVAPLLVKFLEFQIFLLDKLMPVIGPLARGLGGILVGSLRLLTDFLREFVIPAVQTIVAVLTGDFGAATRSATVFTNNLRDSASKSFENLKTRGGQAMRQLAGEVGRQAQSMATGFMRGVSSMVSNALRNISRLPGLILDVLGNLDSLLYNAGIRLMNGFIAGIRNMIPSLNDVLSGITAMIPGIKGPPEKDAKLLTPAGRLVMEGFIRGIDSTIGQLRSRMGQITRDLPSYLDLSGTTAGLGRLAQPGQVTAASGGGGGTTNNFYLSGSDATPDGILHALSWHGLVGGTSG